jgi:hypothetical protein
MGLDLKKEEKNVFLHGCKTDLKVKWYTKQ